MATDNMIQHHQSSSAKSQISKELRLKANDFLNKPCKENNLIDIIKHLENSLAHRQSITSGLLTLEVIFIELLKRRDMQSPDPDSPKPNDGVIDPKFRAWLEERYEQSLTLILLGIGHDKHVEATQALVTAMKLLIAEGKNPLNPEHKNEFPRNRLRTILNALLSKTKSQSVVIQRFKEYSQYLDVLYSCWKLIQSIGTKEDFSNEIYALNFLELMNAIPVTKDIYDEAKMLCIFENQEYKPNYDYSITRNYINRVWKFVMFWCDGSKETVHKQVLIVLLERILPHLDKPVLLTDFLMDSLDCGGAVSLLALQGIFTLIQKHNITYPNIYEKLYSMFEPEIFHTKYKARLFYLADIFLSSTHLPENLVAAFAKRLARLSLIAPPQDTIIILYFIGNLILRHTGLKRLICAEAPAEIHSDPYIMEERDPAKSKALESFLWEIVCLQKHALPNVATAARFISQPLPSSEWDIASMLEVKENDIFDQEISKNAKQYALAFERPDLLYLPKNDMFSKHWDLC